MTEDKTHGALTCNEFELRASQAMGQLYLQGHEALVKRDAAREEFLDAVAWLESLGSIILPVDAVVTMLRCGDHVGFSKKKGAVGEHAPEPATGNGMHEAASAAVASEATKPRWQCGLCDQLAAGMSRDEALPHHSPRCMKRAIDKRRCNWPVCAVCQDFDAAQEPPADRKPGTPVAGGEGGVKS